ncbi:MAG TPA: MGMT family protein [Acidimicrobiia bacterium]
MKRTFDEAVLEVLRRLQPGEVVTYGEVAEEAGFPGAARAVGTLLRRTGEDVPWWRVVASGGHLRATDRRLQTDLLRGEGVVVRRGRVVSAPGPTRQPTG